MEGKEYKIVGEKIDREQFERGYAFLEHEKTEGRKFLEGELKKTPEELKVIEKISQYLQEELNLLGVEKNVGILPEQFHFLPGEKFKKYFPKEESADQIALHYGAGQSAYFNKDGLNRMDLYHSMLHESVHIASVHKHYIAHGAGPKQYRISYGLTRPKSKENYFIGLAEAVTEKTAWDIFSRHKKEFVDDFNVSTAEEKNIGPTYLDYINIVNIIVEKIAKRRGEPSEETWKRFKKGQFTGEMMHLRDVEKTFGKDSLEVLGLLGRPRRQGSDKWITKRILKYFQTEDIEERKKLADELLVFSRLRKKLSKKKPKASALKSRVKGSGQASLKKRLNKEDK